MRFSRAQGAIERRAATARSKLGQGATEYLVLLAAVLIIALVSIALLGWFPGLSGDAQRSESQIAWNTAGGGGSIAIVDASVTSTGIAVSSRPYLRIRNTGSQTLRLSKIFGTRTDSPAYARPFTGPQEWIAVYENYFTGATPLHNLTEIEIPPGEEGCFGEFTQGGKSICAEHRFYVEAQGAPGFPYSQDEHLAIALSSCNSDGTGRLVIKDFGFEYLVVIEGKTLAKRQSWKELSLACGPRR